MNSNTLTRHRDIQEWVKTRQGKPAIRTSPNRFGEMRARLELIFSAPRSAARGETNNGVSPCSWTAWLAELDRRQLALKVGDVASSEFEIVPRRDLN